MERTTKMCGLLLTVLLVTGVQGKGYLVDPSTLPDAFSVNLEPIDDAVHFEICTSLKVGLVSQATLHIRDISGDIFFGDISPRESSPTKSVYRFVVKREHVIGSVFEFNELSDQDSNELLQNKDRYTIRLDSFVSEYYKREYPEAFSNRFGTDYPKVLPGYNRVLEILDRPNFRRMAMPSKRISFDQYKKIKADYIDKNNRWQPGYLLNYRVKEGDLWCYYNLRLEAFDDKNVWLAELAQYRSKGWDWIARYRLNRDPQVDKEFNIAVILENRAKIIGGIKYGMTVKEVFAIKGRDFDINHHAEAGSADLVYDDVTIYVRGWMPTTDTGRVVNVKTTEEGIRKVLQDRAAAPKR